VVAVGIIANPDSGRDVRRVVAQALTVDSQQKTNLIMRMLMALEWMGVDTVWLMPDRTNLGTQALRGLDGHGAVRRASVLDMHTEWSGADTERAAALMRERGAACIIAIGGDGTSRLVAKTCGEVPVLPVSTGTNNVVPQFIEGTVAGLAAGLVARHQDGPPDERCWRHKKLIVHVNGAYRDEALVDVAVVEANALGVKAVWDQPVRQVFVTRAQPTTTGLSSIVGFMTPIGPRQPSGAVAALSQHGHDEDAVRRVHAPMNPGHMTSLWVDSVAPLEPGAAYPVAVAPGGMTLTLALDGERELLLQPGDRATVTLTLDGPWLVDVERTMERAVLDGVFIGNPLSNLERVEKRKDSYGS